MKSKINPFHFPVIVAACFAVINPAAQAADALFIGSAGDHNLTTGSNWVGGNSAGDWNRFVFGSDVVDGLLSLDNFNGRSGITLSSGLTHNITINGPQPLIMGAVQSDGGIDMSSAGANLTINTQYWMWDNATWDVGAGRSLTVNGGLSFDGTNASAKGLTKNGAGTAVLASAALYTGATTVNAGTLQFSGSSANLSASSAVTVNSGGHLSFQPSGSNGTYNYNSFALNLTGQGADANGSHQTVFFGNENVNTYNLGGNVTVAGGVQFATYGIQNTVNLSGTLSGSGDMSFVSEGAGFHTFVFSGDSSATGYTGSYKIYSLGAWNYARLSGGDNRLPTTATVDLESQSGGTAAVLDLNGNNQQLAGLVAGGVTGNGWVQNSGAGTPTLTINNAGPNTFAGKLGEGGTSFALTKAGAGTLTLSGANSYSGVTDITAGTLRIQNNTALGQGGFSASTLTYVRNGASLEIDGSLTIDEHMHLAGSGVGGTGAVRVLSGNSTFTTPIALDNIVKIDVAAGASLTQNNQFYDVGGLTKSGDGTLTLSSTNNYTGATTVGQGKLLVNGSISTSVLTTVASGATIGGSGTVGALTISGDLAPGASGVDVNTLTAGTTTWNGGTNLWDFDLSAASGSADKLVINGDFLKGSDTIFKFDFMNSAPNAWGNLYTLVTWTGSTNFTAANFSFQNLGGSYNALDNNFTINGNSLQFTAVPEPSSALAGLVVAAGLLRRRR